MNRTKSYRKLYHKQISMLFKITKRTYYEKHNFIFSYKYKREIIDTLWWFSRYFAELFRPSYISNDFLTLYNFWWDFISIFIIVKESLYLYRIVSFIVKFMRHHMNMYANFLYKTRSISKAHASFKSQHVSFKRIIINHYSHIYSYGPWSF